jgi:hypothetical protein
MVKLFTFHRSSDHQKRILIKGFVLATTIRHKFPGHFRIREIRDFWSASAGRRFVPGKLSPIRKRDRASPPPILQIPSPAGGEIFVVRQPAGTPSSVRSALFRVRRESLE